MAAHYLHFKTGIFSCSYSPFLIQHAWANTVLFSVNSALRKEDQNTLWKNAQFNRVEFTLSVHFERGAQIHPYKRVFNYTPSVEVTQHNVMCTQAATIAFYLSSRIQYLMGVFPVNFRTSSFITFSLKTVCKTPCPAFLNQHQSERGIWASPHIRGAQTSHQ